MKKITIPCELYSSKNSRQIFKSGNRTFIAKSDRAKQQEVSFKDELPKYRDAFLDLIQGKEKTLKLCFKIYRKTSRQFDYVNIIQNLLDGMVHAGLIPDDNANEIIPFFMPYEKDAKNPRVEISHMDDWIIQDGEYLEKEQCLKNMDEKNENSSLFWEEQIQKSYELGFINGVEKEQSRGIA